VARTAASEYPFSSQVGGNRLKPVVVTPPSSTDDRT
jgi:hypothetical protein